MYSNDEISSLYSYLANTPEGPLRKMLLGGDVTDAHVRVLAKLAKGAPEADFVSAFNAENFGSLRLSPNEKKISENFWPVCKAKLSSLGLLQSSKAAA